MKIIELHAENFKRLRAVEITPDGNIVEIRGKNAQGKSSVLDAIWGLFASADHLPSRPVRDGAEQAYLRASIGGEAVEYVVTRRVTAAGGTTLTVEAPSGARFPSPQRVLDQLIGAISFDPMEFSRARARDQLEQLRAIVKLDVDTDALDGHNRRDYEERTEVNREVAKLRGQASGILYPDGLPASEIDISALTRELNEAGEQNRVVERRRLEREGLSNRIARLHRQADDEIAAVEPAIQQMLRAADGEQSRLKRQIEELQRQLAESVAGVDNAIATRRRHGDELARKLRAEADALEQEQQGTAAVGEPIDTAALLARIEEAQQINAQLRDRNRRETLEAEAAALEERSRQLTEAMETRRQAKAEALARAAFPVPGLSFGDGEVLFNGVPFEQASQAEKIRVSVAIAIAANPRLRVLCVRDGSLLDQDSRRILGELVTTHDYQLWIEVTDDEGKVGVVIEDGVVRGAPEVQIEARKKRQSPPAPAPPEAEPDLLAGAAVAPPAAKTVRRARNAV